MGSFRSIGTVSTVFNGTMTPGAPPGFQAGDILVAAFVEFAGSNTAPDLSAYGFTQKSDNSVVKAPVLYTKTAVGSDAMPTAQFGAGFACCFCAAYTGVTETLDQASVFRGGTTNQSITIPSGAAPPSQNVIAICLAMRNNGSATGVTISNYGNFVQRAWNIPNNTSRPLAVFEDIVMTTPQGITLGSQITSPVDSANQTCQSVIIFLQPIISVSAVPPGENEFPSKIYSRSYPAGIHEYWQVPLTLTSIVQPAPAPNTMDSSVPRTRVFPNSLRSYEQNLLETTLAGKDKVLTSVDWNYGFDSPTSRMYTCLRDESYGLTVAELTALTTYAPYLEYNWPNPQIARRLNQGYEFSFPLSLMGKDQIPTAGFQNNMWDPPKSRPFPVSLRSFEQSGLALYYSVPLKPPLSEANWPIPRGRSRPVQDFVMGTPTAILSALTTFPPGDQSFEIRTGKAFNPVYNGFSSSTLPLLRAPSALPPGGTTYDFSLRPRTTWSHKLYEISLRSDYLVPPTPPPPTSPGQVAGPGGRIIFMPKKQGETVNRQFDFISRLGANEALTGATVFAYVYSGVDSNPQAIIYGGASIQGTIVNQGLTAGITGVVYELLCKVTTTLGQTLEMAAFWVVEPDLP